MVGTSDRNWNRDHGEALLSQASVSLRDLFPLHDQGFHCKWSNTFTNSLSRPPVVPSLTCIHPMIPSCLQDQNHIGQSYMLHHWTASMGGGQPCPPLDHSSWVLILRKYTQKISFQWCWWLLIHSEFLSSSQAASIVPGKPRVHLIRFLIQKVTQMALSVFAFPWNPQARPSLPSWLSVFLSSTLPQDRTLSSKHAVAFPAQSSKQLHNFPLYPTHF